MDLILKFVWAALFLIAHLGLWVSIYNRINALNLPRRVTKPMMKFLLLVAIVLPIYIGSILDASPKSLLLLRSASGGIHSTLQIYSLFVLSSYLWLGLPWLLTRPLFGFGWLSAEIQSEVKDLSQELTVPLPLSEKCKWFAKVPLNQIFELSVEKIELPVKDLPDALDGYRIAHLSDIHFTGDVAPDFTKHVITIANQWKPELFALTGDLIDKQSCIEWLKPVLQHAKASDGSYFILGNHDARMPDTQAIRSEISEAGWIDLGGNKITVCLRGQDVTIVGDESPWLKKPKELDERDQAFRILLSHSPDRIRWASKNQVQLMLAGHTHGGQGRLPLLGPVLSPSLYGSRYASGQFFQSPTTLHVTRGLSGTRLLRINCRPELSLLTLRRSE